MKEKPSWRARYLEAQAHEREMQAKLIACRRECDQLRAEKTRVEVYAAACEEAQRVADQNLSNLWAAAVEIKDALHLMVTAYNTVISAGTSMATFRRQFDAKVMGAAYRALTLTVGVKPKGTN